MPRKINEEAFKWCLDYEWTGKGAAKVQDGHERFTIQQDAHDYDRESLLSEPELWLLQKYRTLSLRGFRYVTGGLRGTPWGRFWGERGDKKGLKWGDVKNSLLNLGYLQALHITPLHTTSYCDAPPSESRCDSSSGVSDTQLKAANDSKRQRTKKEKKPVNEQRAKDSALVRKIFQGRYQSKFGMVYSEWGGRQIGQSHAFVNHLRQIFTDVDEITVEMVIVGYFSDKESWCGDSEPGSVKSIGFMSTSGNIQSSINIMKRVYGQARPEMDERELQYVERVAKIRDFSETGSREAANEQEDGDQGVQTKGSD